MKRLRTRPRSQSQDPILGLFDFRAQEYKSYIPTAKRPLSLPPRVFHHTNKGHHPLFRASLHASDYP